MATYAPATSKTDKLGLSKIADGIWFVQGDHQKRPLGNTDPTVILIFGWMGAKIAHVAKYSAAYKTVFPYADQIVVACYVDVFILPKFVSRRRLRPVADLLRTLGVTGDHPKPHRILCHSMSNGGTCQLNYLSQILPRPRSPADRKTLPSAIILDSNPGGDDVNSAVNVFRGMMPNPLILYPFLGLLFFIHSVSALLRLVPWSLHDIIRSSLCNPYWLPWTSELTPLLYVYSKSDKIVPYAHIQAHTEVAEKTRDVTRLVLDSSGHVEHMRAAPELYWGAVKDVWAKAISNAQR